MLFNSFAFLLVFLPITYAVFWLLNSAQARYAWLATTGYVFYSFWDPRFCLLMLFSTVVSYVAGLGLLHFHGKAQRTALLVVPIVIDLCLLGFFKYAGFMLESARSLARFVGSDLSIPAIDIILPVGISFYTFHTISYIIDSYRGVVRPTKNFLEFSAYVSLFSQLVAGPIVRFREVQQDYANLAFANRRRGVAPGLGFFLIGMVEKVVLADSLAAFVNPLFDAYATLSAAEAWLAMFGYSLQLYFDFCGYSDMAVGLGLLFGIQIPQNFNSPYKATDPADFWRRWHISLSTCMRDYLYIPMGGSRIGTASMYRNLLITMVIGGLWHGANWTFVVWGTYHGILLVLYRAFQTHYELLSAAIRRACTFLLVLIGWVFFRAPSMDAAFTLLRAMFSLPIGQLEVSLPYAITLAVAAAWAFFGPNAFDIYRERHWKPWHGFLLSPAFGVCIALMVGGRSSPFLYFQF